MRRFRESNPAEPWAIAFEIDGKDAVFRFRLSQLYPLPRDVFSGKLRAADRYSRAVRAGEVKPMRPSLALSMEAVIDVLCLLAAHNRIARTGEFRLAPPAFWVRSDDGIRPGMTRRLVPAMPVKHLQRLSGMDQETVQRALGLLYEDKAIRLVVNGQGDSGIVLRDGFVSDASVRGILRT